jgi:S-adenosyl methyltransferase
VAEDWRDDKARMRQAALIDSRRPNAVRVADYFDGGGDNFEADRKAARELVAAAPVISLIAPAWRGFLQRVVRYLIREAGMRQFLFVNMTLADSNVHEIVWSEDPACRIVLADDDPLVLAHSRAFIRPEPDRATGRPNGAAGYVAAGLRDPAAIIAGARATLDFGQPVAVMLLFVLAFVDDTAAAANIVSALTDPVLPGSHVAIHHIASDVDPALSTAARHWNRQSPQRITLRSRAEVASLIGGLDPIPPGLVPITDWRPAPGDARPEFTIPLYGIVARKA